MYKIGDKVETPQFIGIIEKIYESGVKVNGKMFPLKDIKPYKSAHDKLLAMGWEEKIHDVAVKRDVESGRYKQYVKGSEVILIDIENKDFTTYTLYNGSKGVDDVSWVNLTLSRILTQYLEELEAKE